MAPPHPALSPTGERVWVRGNQKISELFEKLQFNTLSGLNYYKFITNVFFWSKYTQRGHMAQGHTGLTGLSIYHQQIP